MKKIKILFIITCILALITPNFVNALTEEEANEILNSLPIKEVNGKTIMETKIVDPTYMIGDQCSSNKDDSTTDEWIKECKTYLYQDIIITYLKYLGYDTNDLFLEVNENDYKNAVFSYDYESTEGTKTLSVNVEVSYLKDVDTKEIEKAKKVLAGFEDSDRLYGLQLINLIYHYGAIEDADYNKETIFARYQDFKKTMEEYPEYKFISNGGRGGGDSLVRERYIQAGMFKDGIMYGIKQVIHHENQILFVDKDSTGNIKEKIEARLNEYFNNKVDVNIEIDDTFSIEDIYATDEISGREWFNNFVNEILGTNGLEFTSYLASIKINDVEMEFIVTEVPSKYVNNLYVEAYDSTTGVSIKTESYDVPIDAVVNAKDIKNNTNIINNFENDRQTVESAYDISLIKYYNGSFIHKIDKGIEVYLPLDGEYNSNLNYKVYYVSSTNEKEEYDTEIVTINGKNYAKFVTNHFSSYVLTSETKGKANTENTVVENPQTLDSASENILMIIVSFIILCTTICFIKNKKHTIN